MNGPQQPAPSRERLLLVGWPGADWDVAAPLAAAGRMPHLAALLARGCTVSVSVPPPDCRAAVWATAATGLLADRHGVLHDWEERWDGGGVQPAGRKSWQAPAFWELLEQAGFSTACVGWPATAPGADWPGCHVDARFAQASGSSFETWAVPPGTVAPPGLREELRGLRIHPADGLRDQAVALWPEAAGLESRHDTRPLLLEAALAEAGTLHAVATHLAETGWDALCICYGLLGLIAGAEGEPHHAGLRARTYGLHDMLLGRLVQLAGPAVTVMVLSAGVAPGRPGFLVAAGPGIAAGGMGSAALADVAPTILARFGLTAETDGVPMAALSGVAAGLRVMAALPRSDDAPASVVGGGADRLTAGQAAAIAHAGTSRLLNLAAVQMARGALPKAAASLERVVEAWPGHSPTLRRLAQCRALLGDAEACRPLADALLAADPQDPFGHLVIGACHVLAQDGAGAQPHLDQAYALGRGDPQVIVRLGGIQLLRDRPMDAEALFREALALSPGLAEALHGLGSALAAQGNAAAAEQALREGIARQHAQPLAHLELANALLAQSRWREALDVLDAVRQHFPAVPGLQSSLAHARVGLAQQIASAVLRSP